MLAACYRALKPPKPRPTNNGGVRPNDLSQVAKRARGWLAKKPGTICRTGSCHINTFNAACELVLRFDMRPEEAYPLLAEWAAKGTHPWTEAELMHKLEGAVDQPDHRGEKFANDTQRNGNGKSHANVSNSDHGDAYEGDSIADEAEKDQEPERSKIKAVPITQLVRVNVNREFVLEKLIPKNTITLLSGLWKAGKTTLFAWLILALISGTPFIGLATRRCRVLIITEEDADIWCDRRDALGLTDEVGVIVSPFLGKPTLGQWRDFLRTIVDIVTAERFDVVFLDTIFSLWPVENENESGPVTNAMLPFRTLKEVATVVLGGHLSKADSTQGRGTRGSGALMAHVDTIIELRRKGDDIEDTKRELTSLGRYSPPPIMLIDFDSMDGYSHVGGAKPGTEGRERRREKQERETDQQQADDSRVMQAIRDLKNQETPATARQIEIATATPTQTKLSRARTESSIFRLRREKLIKPTVLSGVKGRFGDSEAYELVVDLDGLGQRG